MARRRPGEHARPACPRPHRAASAREHHRQRQPGAASRGPVVDVAGEVTRTTTDLHPQAAQPQHLADQQGERHGGIGRFQSWLDSAGSTTRHAVAVGSLAKGCTNDVLMFGRLLQPAIDQTWLANKPQIHGPACARTTPVGPRPRSFAVSRWSVAVGRRKTAAAPERTLPAVGCVLQRSPRPFQRRADAALLHPGLRRGVEGRDQRRGRHGARRDETLLEVHHP